MARGGRLDGRRAVTATHPSRSTTKTAAVSLQPAAGACSVSTSLVERLCDGTTAETRLVELIETVAASIRWYRCRRRRWAVTGASAQTMSARTRHRHRRSSITAHQMHRATFYAAASRVLRCKLPAAQAVDGRGGGSPPRLMLDAPGWPATACNHFVVYHCTATKCRLII